MTTPEPAPAAAPAPEPAPSAKAPVEPPAAAPAPASPSSTPAAPGTWVALPNLGKGRPVDDDRFAFDPPSEPAARRIERVSPAAAPAAAAPVADRVNTVDHVVQSQENFWTISRLYYGYGRFWNALWAANRTPVPAPEKLYVGQKNQIPPPEALDRSLFEPEPAPRSSKTAGRSAPSSGSTVSASALRRA